MTEYARSEVLAGGQTFHLSSVGLPPRTDATGGSTAGTEDSIVADGIVH